MAHTFSLENETKVNEIEQFLTTHAYLSGKSNPGEEDAQILHSLKDAPDRLKHPNFFAYWWGLTLFQESARAVWGKETHATDKKKEGKDKKTTTEQTKKEDKPAPKAEEKPKKADDDELDLFGDDGDAEADKKVLEEMKKKKEEDDKKKKAEKKVVIAKSNVVFDVKAYEETFDFPALGKEIKEKIKVDGLIWHQTFKILPVAYNIKKLQCGMVIEDDKVSADDILEKIQELWPDDIQSCDIVEFNKI